MKLRPPATDNSRIVREQLEHVVFVQDDKPQPKQIQPQPLPAKKPLSTSAVDKVRRWIKRNRIDIRVDCDKKYNGGEVKLTARFPVDKADTIFATVTAILGDYKCK